MATTKIQLSSQQQTNADVSVNSFKITNLANGTNANDAVNKSQLDSVSAGLDVKQSVRAATTVAGTLASSFENGDIIDGVTLVTGDRILIKNQSTGSENGIYTVNASGSPTRATDADTSSEVTGGMFTFVNEGTINADSGWVLTTDDTINLGATALTFTQFTGSGSIPDASETVKGKIEIATQTETDTGTDDTRAITPLKLQNSSLIASKLSSTLADGKIFVGNASNVATAQTLSGDVTITNTAVATVISASETAAGKAEIATQAEVNAGTDDARYVTPLKLTNFTGLTSKLSATNFVFNEALTVTHNSPTPSNLVNSPVSGTVQVFLNGLLQQPGAGNDYTISGSTITFTFNLKNSGGNVDVVLVHYIK